MRSFPKPQRRSDGHGRGRIAGTPRPSEPLQPGFECDVEDLLDDEYLDRLLGDANLLYRLQLSGYAAEEWRRPSEEFGRYGYDVLVGWMFTGRIWHEVFKKTGRHPRRPEVPFDEDTIRQLCADIVINGLEAFLENDLKRNRWDPERGASLKTYFVGQCCFQFENVLRSHYRRLKRNREDLVSDPTDWRAPRNDGRCGLAGASRRGKSRRVRSDLEREGQGGVRTSVAGLLGSRDRRAPGRGRREGHREHARLPTSEGEETER